MIIRKTTNEAGEACFGRPNKVRVMGTGEIAPPKSAWPKRWNAPATWFDKFSDCASYELDDNDGLPQLTGKATLKTEDGDVVYNIRYIDRGKSIGGKPTMSFRMILEG